MLIPIIFEDILHTPKGFTWPRFLLRSCVSLRTIKRKSRVKKELITAWSCTYGQSTKVLSDQLSLFQEISQVCIQHLKDFKPQILGKSKFLILQPRPSVSWSYINVTWSYINVSEYFLTTEKTNECMHAFSFRETLQPMQEN